MTLQEIFNRAWRGLEAQGWRRAMAAPTQPDEQLCTYYRRTPDGEVLRCAWGHVDPEGTVAQDPHTGEVVAAETAWSALAKRKLGIAVQRSQLDFIGRLVWAHDEGYTPETMRKTMTDLATAYGLEVPATCSKKSSGRASSSKKSASKPRKRKK